MPLGTVYADQQRESPAQLQISPGPVTKVYGFLSNSVLLSSSGKQPRAMEVSCVVLETLKPPGQQLTRRYPTADMGIAV